MGIQTHKLFVCFTIISIYSINASPVQIDDLTNGLSQFARDFYSQCVKTKPGNVIVSPLSVASALALLSQGTSDKTFEELRNGLHLGSDKTATANQFLAQREALGKSVGDATLSIANQIYVQQGPNLNKNFEDVAVSKFKSGVEPLNFADSVKSAQTINNFVEENTNGKIKNLIEADTLSSDTRSVLVNAIYFKGNWEHQFKKENTHKADFFINDNEKVSTDFMFMNHDVNIGFVTDLGAKVLELKYANSSLSFVIVLPNQSNGLAEVETKLKDYDWNKITETMHNIEADVHIPKFKVEYEIKLNDVLKNMGINEIFSESGNLGGILDSGERLIVSEAIHKAFIEINEEGTEAAAATGLEVMLLSMPPQFNANHPFMYFIRDTETNTVIFSGRIEKF